MADKIYTLRTQRRNGVWAKIRDCGFATMEKAKAYCDNYHTDKHGACMVQIMEHEEFDAGSFNLIHIFEKRDGFWWSI